MCGGRATSRGARGERLNRRLIWSRQRRRVITQGQLRTRSSRGASMMRFGPWLALCVLAVSEAWASPPLDAYGKLPSIEGAQISPDGAHFAMILTDGDLRSVAIFKTSDRKAVKVIRAATAKIRQLQWAGPDDLIVTVSKDMEVVGLENDKREWFLASDYNIKTGKTQALLDRIDSRMDNGGRDLNTLNSEPMVRSINNKPHVFVESFHFSSGRGENSLYDFDPGTGIANLIGIGVDHTNAWLVDAKGRPLAQTLYDAKAKRWTLKVREGETLRPVKAFEQDIEHPAMIGLGRDGASVLLVVDTDTKDGLISARSRGIHARSEGLGCADQRSRDRRGDFRRAVQCVDRRPDSGGRRLPVPVLQFRRSKNLGRDREGLSGLAGRSRLHVGRSSQVDRDGRQSHGGRSLRDRRHRRAQG